METRHNAFLRAVLGTFIPIIVLLLSGQTFAEAASSFNKNGSVKEYIRHGTIYDRNELVKGYIRDGLVYDNNWELVRGFKGSTIYEREWISNGYRPRK